MNHMQFIENLLSSKSILFFSDNYQGILVFRPSKALILFLNWAPNETFSLGWSFYSFFIFKWLFFLFFWVSIPLSGYILIEYLIDGVEH